MKRKSNQGLTMTRGRKAKANIKGPDSRSHKRQPKVAEAFAGATARKDAVAKVARAKPPALSSLIKALVKSATSSDSAARQYTAALTRIRKQGVTLDDVGSLVVARMIIAEDAMAHESIDIAKGLTELGRCNRELAELAAAYREQGRSLPDQISFRLDLTTSTVSAGEQPKDAPAMATDGITGDVIETE